jgi:hypothetical protein
MCEIKIAVIGFQDPATNKPAVVAGSLRVFGEPGEIGVRTAGNGENEELGRFVGMETEDFTFERL